MTHFSERNQTWAWITGRPVETSLFPGRPIVRRPPIPPHPTRRENGSESGVRTGYPP